MPGVLQQHRDRMANDERYRRAALAINPEGAGGAALGKYLKTDAPTSLTIHQGDTTRSASTSGTSTTVGSINWDELAGDDLDQAVKDADIPGRSSMTADEKRAALRNHHA